MSYLPGPAPCLGPGLHWDVEIRRCFAGRFPPPFWLLSSFSIPSTILPEGHVGLGPEFHRDVEIRRGWAGRFLPPLWLLFSLPIPATILLGGYVVQVLIENFCSD